MSKEDMIEVNKSQSAFYSKEINTNKNIIYRFWDSLRKKGFWAYRQFLGIDEHVMNLHKIWMGDISNKSVLDFGCGAGNLLSPYLAEHAKKYVAMDLSEFLILKLKSKLVNKGINKGEFISGDFLSHEFQHQFDIIYAFGVMHHFKDFDVLLERLNSCLADKGVILTYDPTNVSLISKAVRGLYRPFQPDADWEFPFRNADFDRIKARFRIHAVQGYFGKSVWLFPAFFFAGKRNFILELAKKFHHHDLNNLTIDSDKFRRAMNVTMLLGKK